MNILRIDENRVSWLLTEGGKAIHYKEQPLPDQTIEEAIAVFKSEGLTGQMEVMTNAATTLVPMSEMPEDVAAQELILKSCFAGMDEEPMQVFSCEIPLIHSYGVFGVKSDVCSVIERAFPELKPTYISTDAVFLRHFASLSDTPQRERVYVCCQERKMTIIKCVGRKLHSFNSFPVMQAVDVTFFIVAHCKTLGIDIEQASIWILASDEATSATIAQLKRFARHVYPYSSSNGDDSEKHKSLNAVPRDMLLYSSCIR